MNSFVLNLYDATHELKIEGVISFIGEDASGRFGILPGHARFMTILGFGLARFRQQDNNWQYLAVPGGVLYFKENALGLSTRRFLVDTDFERINALLEQELAKEEENLRTTRISLLQMEQALFKRILSLQRNPGWAA